MQDQVEIPEHDEIDEQLLVLIHKMVGEEADEEEIDAASNVLFSLIEQLVDEQEIIDVPEAEAPEEDKQTWLKECLPVVKEGFEDILRDLSSDEFEELSGEAEQ